MIIGIIKNNIFKILSGLIVVLILSILLFSKYDYEVIQTMTIDKSDWSEIVSTSEISAGYEDAVLKIKGVIVEGKVWCYYLGCKSQYEMENAEKLINIEREYEAPMEIDESIEIGSLDSKIQCVGFEVVGDEEVKLDLHVVLEARRYGYQILEGFLIDSVLGGLFSGF